MDPKLGLLAASGLVSFLLKTTAEWLVCMLLVRIAGSARIRFNLWLTLLLGFVAQWVWMGAHILRVAFPAPASSGAAGVAAAHQARITVAGTRAGTVAQAMLGLLMCYLAILAWRALGSLLARVRLARVMRYKTEPDTMLAKSFQEALDQTASYGAKLRDCELWVLPGLPSPATLGWRKPRVIVPTVCRMQDEAELKVVFWHELMHVERRDALWNALVRACRNILWFHPWVHYATAALNAERELACDAAVVREHPQSRDAYATCLVRFARARDLAPEPSVAGIEMASGAALLTTRIRSILSDVQRASRLSIALRSTVGLVLVGTMAATVPALNVLFAEEVIGPAIRLPMLADVHPADKRHGVRPATAKLEATVAPQSARVDVPAVASMTMPHDESLAAEHRAGLDVLTEATGMDGSGSREARVSGISGPAPSHGVAAQSPASWTTVAVQAAERMGPLMSGHDSDDHH